MENGWQCSSRWPRRPGLVDWDFSLFKSTEISERIRLQFRAEFFNILNHTNLSLPNEVVYAAGPTQGTVANQTTAAALGSPGVISATANTSRQIQLGLKAALLTTNHELRVALFIAQSYVPMSGDPRTPLLPAHLREVNKRPRRVGVNQLHVHAVADVQAIAAGDNTPLKRRPDHAHIYALVAGARNHPRKHLPDRDDIATAATRFCISRSILRSALSASLQCCAIAVNSASL